ncbi:hypothetical protein J8281_04860 [Aquimarina sp. U1-2]|uniref:hypothetical protein n=1 Tax=Aquimarina sp. U1-2 TaxID=2823141 RepID=UPI001AECA42D|nr:hypothetical protein [Aquimarina sp. U1-2]MBP2831511.1 hypothetical protein [Aquimarina sp. U1-2]
MKTNIVFLILILSLQHIRAQKLDKYTGSVTVNMKERVYIADLNITFDSFLNSDVIKLYIQGGAQINAIKSQGVSIPYEITAEELVYDSRKKQLLIAVDNIYQKSLNISYSTSFDEIKNKRFQYKPDWAEFNIYTDWFPWNINYGLFHYEVKINSKDTIIGAHLLSNNVLKSTRETFDIPFLVSSKAKKISTKNKKIHIYSHQVADSIIESIQNKSQQFYAHFEKTYGPTNSKELHIIVNNSKRSLAYARPNYISLAFDEKFTKIDFKTLAHEIAHLWWDKADLATWEDWLNEGFAEYSSMRIYSAEYGQDICDEWIKKIDSWIQKLEAPSVWGIDKNNSKSNAVLTYKAALILQELEHKMGKEKMDMLLRETHEKQIKTTKNLLKLVTKLTDQTTSQWFEEQLKK